MSSLKLAFDKLSAGRAGRDNGRNGLPLVQIEHRKSGCRDDETCPDLRALRRKDRKCPGFLVALRNDPLAQQPAPLRDRPAPARELLPDPVHFRRIGRCAVRRRAPCPQAFRRRHRAAGRESRVPLLAGYRRPCLHAARLASAPFRRRGALCGGAARHRPRSPRCGRRLRAGDARTAGGRMGGPARRAHGPDGGLSGLHLDADGAAMGARHPGGRG